MDVSRIEMTKVAACNCTTKTPEWQYHHETCRYRIICEMQAEIIRLKEAIEVLRDNAFIAEENNKFLHDKLRTAEQSVARDIAEFVESFDLMFPDGPIAKRQKRTAEAIKAKYGL